VSTESGIPDFRSDSGIWADVDPFEVASIQAFRRNPERVWSFYRERIHLLREAEPNAAHQALAELERRGLVAALVTQNIDTLHSRAGSRDVIEVHGSIRSAVCLQCLSTEAADDVLAQLEDSPTPICIHCGDVLKPGVTLFGELLPPGAIERATDLPRPAGSVLFVGSSLEVWPVPGCRSRPAHSPSSTAARLLSTTARCSRSTQAPAQHSPPRSKPSADGARVDCTRCLAECYD